MEKGKAGAPPNFILVLLILTLIGAGSGAGFAFFMLGPTPTAADGASQGKPMPVQKSKFPLGSVEVPLKPIIVTFGEDKPRMLRLEGSLIFAQAAPDMSLIKSEIEADIATFLAGVDIEETHGVRGFQNLREDIEDRAKMRGRGAVVGFLISGFVFE